MQLRTPIGPKLSLASSSELRLSGPEDAGEAQAGLSDAQSVLSDAQANLLIGDLAAKHGVSVDRARMLLDRFGTARHGLDAAALDLQAWKL